MNHVMKKIFGIAVLVCFLVGTGLVMARGEKPEDAFFRLCAKGTAEEVSKALYSGANINAQDAQGMTALMYAARDNADPTVMRVLLIAAAEFQEKGLLQGWRGRLRSKTIDVNDRNQEGMTALMFAVENNSPKIVQVLLNVGADANARDKQDMTVLMRAVMKKSSKEMVIMLLDDGADANARDKQGMTALMFAVENNSPEVVQVLLDAGADVNAKDQQKRTVLIRAVKKKSSPEMVKMLLSAGADVNAQDEKKRTVLMYAARYSDLKVMKILVDAGADVRAAENSQVVKELEKRINP